LALHLLLQELFGPNLRGRKHRSERGVCHAVFEICKNSYNHYSTHIYTIWKVNVAIPSIGLGLGQKYVLKM